MPRRRSVTPWGPGGRRARRPGRGPCGPRPGPASPRARGPAPGRRAGATVTSGAPAVGGPVRQRARARMPCRGSSSSAVAASSAGRGPVSAASRAVGRQGQLAPLVELALGEPGGVPAHERLDGRERHVGGGAGERPPGRRRSGAHERGRCEPAAQGLLPRGQAGALEQGPGVEEERGGIPAGGHRLGAGCRHDEPRARPRTESSTVPAPDRSTGMPGNARPSSSAVRRAPTTEERSRWPPQAGHVKPVSTRPHQRQAGRSLRPGEPERPGAHRAPGRAAAVLAGQRGQVAAARHLHEHRATLEGLLRGAPGDGGQVGRGHRRVAVGVVALAGDPHRRHGAPHSARGAPRPAVSTPRATRSATATDRPNPADSTAAPCTAARASSTSRTCG